MVLAFVGCGQNHDEKSIMGEITNIENGFYLLDVNGRNIKVPVANLDTGNGQRLPDREPSVIENVIKIDLVHENTDKESN